MLDRNGLLMSAGGPLLLIAEDLLPEWGGIDPPEDREIEATFRWAGPDSDASDYDRACDVEGYIAPITVGAGMALVLGDAPLSTTWVPDADGNGGVIVRGYFSSSAEKVLRLIEDVPADSWTLEPFDFAVGTADLYMIDSGMPGDALEGEDHLVFLLPPGDYSVATAEYEPEDHPELVLHRLSLKTS